MFDNVELMNGSIAGHLVLAPMLRIALDCLRCLSAVGRSRTNEIATIEAAAFGALSEAGVEAGNAVVAPDLVDYEASRS